MNLNLHYKYGGNRHALHKFLLVMNSDCRISNTAKRKIIMRANLIVLLITTAILQVSASTYAQKITLNKTNMPLEKVMKEIRLQSGYDFFYDLKLIKNTNPVSINVKDASLEEVLDKCFDNQPLTYKIGDKVVMIKEKETSFLDKIVDQFRNIDVRGRIVDSAGNALPGATVQIKGTNRSVKTSINGGFSFADVKEDAVLVISYVGFESREVAAVSDLGTLTLNAADAKLEEVKINAGYYSVTDRERTGNISRITADDIKNQPINNPLMALVGRIPGLQIIQNSGVPGSDFTVQIRGTNSLKSGNFPLYIVDGVIYPSSAISNSSTTLILNGTTSPLSLINPNDIESIEVLKDADATSIYGSRGANGVILITTKRGKSGDTKVNASFSQGFSKVGNKVDLMNTEQYIQMRLEAFKNDNIEFGTNDYDVNNTWSRTEYTDWQKKLIGGKALTTNASLSVNGGTTNSNYIIGGNYYKEGTVFPGDFGFKRMGIHSSINLGSTNNRFLANFTFNYNRTESNLLAGDITEMIQLAPNQPNSYDEYGQLNWANGTISTNPMASLLQTSNAETDNLIGNVILSYRLFDNLSLKTSLGYNKIIRREFQKTPLASFSPTSFGYGASLRTSNFGNNFANSLSAEPILTYHTRLLNGKIETLLGASYQTNKSQNSLISANGFTSDDIMGNPGSAVTITNSNFSALQYKYVALFARVNYSLSDKYFVNLTARRDGSSRFGPDKQFANFGAIGAAWIFSNERLFIDHLTFLSFGKLRGSYGITGNDQISDYGYLQLYNSSTPYQNNATLFPARTAPNADFAWETNRKLETAIQLSFLENKLNFDLSYYRNRSSNQLIAQNLPLSTGLNSVQRNLPAVIQNKGLELDADIKIINSQNFKWSSALNFTKPKNTLLSYPSLSASTDVIKYQIGQPLNILKVYNITVNQQTGLYTFEDSNNNGTRDNGDRYIPVFLGQKFYGGFQNSFTFGKFGLDFHLTFAKQRARSYASNASLSPGFFLEGAYSNQLSSISNQRWQNQDNSYKMQKYSTTFDNYLSSLEASSFGNSFVVDASYIKLRNVVLNWSLPDKFLSTLKLDNAVLSLQSQNLFTITNYEGLDPEVPFFKLPQLRTIMVGINITF
ncbi:MAG: SusC/RagA family TonB-linked outer membrane protein [Bacteroidota bacterium]